MGHWGHQYLGPFQLLLPLLSNRSWSVPLAKLRASKASKTSLPLGDPGYKPDLTRTLLCASSGAMLPLLHYCAASLGGRSHWGPLPPSTLIAFGSHDHFPLLPRALLAPHVCPQWPVPGGITWGPSRSTFPLALLLPPLTLSGDPGCHLSATDCHICSAHQACSLIYPPTSWTLNHSSHQAIPCHLGRAHDSSVLALCRSLPCFSASSLSPSQSAFIISVQI